MPEENYGRVINVSSVTDPVASNPGETAYSAAKAGMVGMTRSLALEVASKGITMNAVAPGGSKPRPPLSTKSSQAKTLQ
jgi:3-oxoacyl-[acyl-carrier protein] reductase